MSRRQPLIYKGVALRCCAELEQEAQRAGYAVVAGVDEVGRGALFGPLVAGAVVLGDGFDTTDLDDSKRMSAARRERLARRVRQDAVAWALGRAEVEEIERLNVLRATQLAMRRALGALDVSPDFVLVDGGELPELAWPQRAVVKGDARSVSIAAASILAKVSRDEMMQECDSRFPGYGLARNMGYGSAAHRAALRRLGPSRLHRRSFQGVRQACLF